MASGTIDTYFDKVSCYENYIESNKTLTLAMNTYSGVLFIASTWLANTNGTILSIGRGISACEVSEIFKPSGITYQVDGGTVKITNTSSSSATYSIIRVTGKLPVVT
ncbi:MAG: hypothetical protein J6Y28_04170 [Acholeplasmatales bacterium]|nr:hypothetical protein [Methanobrevibacter sp.]MBP5445349.1 hypothetical protein [Acholeplasmatales bacterium]